MEMKKILILSMMLLGALTIQARGETEGSLAALKGETKMKVVEDWTETKIAGRTLADWLQFRQAEQPEYNAKEEWEDELKPRLMKDLPSAANDKLKNSNFFLTKEGDAKYVMTIHPVSVERKGNCVIEFTIQETKTDRQIARFTITGSGGTFGTMSNLWGDGFKSAGKRLGTMIAKALKSADRH